MEKKRFCCLLLLCGALLAGCASPAASPESSPTPPPIEAPTVDPLGPAGQAARNMLAPFEAQLQAIADAQTGNISYTIPGSMLNQFALDAAAQGAAAQNGRYQFAAREEGQYTYSVSAQTVQSALAEENKAASPTPENDAPRSDTYLGEDTTQGGGSFVRVQAYDVAEDLSQGRVEITETLNGERTGYEIFTFSLRDGALYFADAAPALNVAVDALEISDEFLIVIGRLESGAAEIIEYQGSSGDIPQADAMDFDLLARSVHPVSRLTAKGGQVTVSP